MMGWRSEPAQSRSRVLAQCFAGADQGSGAAQLENELWQEASSWEGYCETLARKAASLGHESCLRVLHVLGAQLGDQAFVFTNLVAANTHGWSPAHIAASQGREGCLRVLHELCGDAATSMKAKDYIGHTPAQLAAQQGHAGCLRVLHRLGGNTAASVSSVDANGKTPAHHAAANGHASCLRVLHELGGKAAASLVAANVAADASAWTPAHQAAANGQEGCLRVLHELFCMTIDPQLATLAGIANIAGTEDLILELRARRSLAWTQGTKPFDHVDLAGGKFSAAALAANKGHADCFRFIAEVGGAASFLLWLRGRESVIDANFPCLLTNPTLLDLATKRSWLNAQLVRKVQAVGSDADVNLIVRRDDMLQGLCDALGVHETTGQVNAQAGSVNVTFEDQRRSPRSGRLSGLRTEGQAACLLHGRRVPADAVRRIGDQRGRLAGLGRVPRWLLGGLRSGQVVLG